MRGRDRPRPARGRWRAAWALPAVAALALAGCGRDTPAPGPPAPAASSTSVGDASPSPSSSSSAGKSLAELGFRYGPDAFRVPAEVVFVTTVDQPNVVTLVVSFPSPAALAEFLRSTLPSEGFTVTASGADTLTFVGRGWTGAFTASAGTSAIVLRPA